MIASGSRHRLNSRVVSASLGHAGRHVELSRPARVTLRHLTRSNPDSSNLTDPICVFWDLESHRWSDAGCRVASTDNSATVCECDHLTHFALMMRPLEDGEEEVLSSQTKEDETDFVLGNLDVFGSVLAAVIVFAVFISVMMVSSRFGVSWNFKLVVF
jgi:hypothetical protein